MISAKGLHKRYEKTVAVDDLSFEVRAGVVTGFLGPNGSGKSTTMRLMLGLDHGGGETLFDGERFTSIRRPMNHVGTLLEAKQFHPTRSARNHLKMLASANGIANARIDRALDLVGLGPAKRKKPKVYSLGMSQRLGLAQALLGDPHTLMLDEPTNGLDPHGIHSATGHEYRHGTIQPTLTALPRRSRLILAKILTVTALTAVATLVSIAINATLVLVFWGEVPGLFDDPVRSALLGYLAYNVIYALVGLGLGLLFRGVPAALVVIFLMPLIIETLIVGLTMVPALEWLASAVKFLPFTAGEELMLTSPANFGPAAPDFDFFDRWASGGVFAVFAALITGAVWILFQKRDA